MSILSEEEARALVAVRGHCDDLDCWKEDPAHPGAWEIECGVEDEYGERHDQYINLRVTRSPLTGNNMRFTFTLFRKTHFEQSRLYQLELICSSRAATAWHQRSHEHLGSSRCQKCSDWKNWGYEQALAHFCTMSNIYLDPIPPAPTSLKKEKGHARKHH